MVVTLAGGGTALVQGLELHIQAVQGSSGAGSGWGCRTHQEDCRRGCHWGSCWRPARAGGGEADRTAMLGLGVGPEVGVQYPWGPPLAQGRRPQELPWGPAGAWLVVL